MEHREERKAGISTATRRFQGREGFSITGTLGHLTARHQSGRIEARYRDYSHRVPKALPVALVKSADSQGARRVSQECALLREPYCQS